MNKLFDWNNYSESIKGGISTHRYYESMANDNEIIDEYFQYRKTGLNKLMERVYFPEIDVQEHHSMFSKHDHILRLEHEKLHDKILVEMITLQSIMKKLGFDD